MFDRYIETKYFLEIPETNLKYFINIDGVVKNVNGEIIESSRDSNGNLVVKIDWVLGYKEYGIAVLLCFTFKPMYIPVKFWVKLQVMFKDYNKYNVHPSNLVWKFPIGLGALENAGFAFIPMFSRYGINKNGDVKNLTTNNILSVLTAHHKNSFGYSYKYYTLEPDIGNKTTCNRHRALCLAWKDYPAHVDLMEVNHINCIPGDDWLNNLELITPDENIEHAIKNGVTGNNLGARPVLIRNVKTDTIQEFKSLIEASNSLGVLPKVISIRATSKGQKTFKDYNQYKYKIDDTPWKISDDYESEIQSNYNRTAILMRDCVSGVVSEYRNKKECARKLNIHPKSLDYWIKLPNQQVVQGLKQYKYKADNTPWRIPVNPEEELDRYLNKHRLLVRNALTGEIIEYTGTPEYARLTNIDRSTIRARTASKGQKVYPNYLQFKYKADPTPWYEPTKECLENMKFKYNSY